MPPPFPRRCTKLSILAYSYAAQIPNLKGNQYFHSFIVFLPISMLQREEQRQLLDPMWSSFFGFSCLPNLYLFLFSLVSFFKEKNRREKQRSDATKGQGGKMLMERVSEGR